jgi:hypothetical protein
MKFGLPLIQHNDLHMANNQLIKSKPLKCHEKNSSAGPKNRPAQLSQ